MTQEKKQRVQALWQQIERGLFWPVSQSDQRTWCACFVSSLAGLWGVDTPVVTAPFPKATLCLPIPGFAIEYDLSKWALNPQRASFRVTFEGAEVVSYHIDHAYEDRMKLYDHPRTNTLALYPDVTSRNNELLADIQWVLDRFLFHPCTHVHLGSDILGCLMSVDEVFRECLHEIRLCMGNTNPFASLFQYRVNLVLRGTREEIKSAKEAECNRIAEIIRDAILHRTGDLRMPAGELFKCMR